MPYTLTLIYKISASECARCEETKPLSASEKVLDAKNDDDGVLEVLLGVILKQMMPYTLALI